MHAFLEKIWLDIHRISKHHTVLLIFQGGRMRDLGWHRSSKCVRELLSQTSKNDSVGSQLKSGRTSELSVQNQANMYWANLGGNASLFMCCSAWSQPGSLCHYSRVFFCRMDALPTSNGQSIVPGGLLLWKYFGTRMHVQWRQLSVEWKLFEI